MLIGDFFEELDGLWTAGGTGASAKVRLRLIGSTALMIQTSYARGTKDSDVLETSDLTDDVRRRLRERAGKTSKLCTKYRVYVELVPAGLPFLPQAPLYHPVVELNRGLKSLEVAALDIVDVVVSKLARFHANDRADNGLVIVIDEAETILRMRGDVRGKSLNGIRQIIDAAGKHKGLLWVFTGTPEFFDTRRGVAGLQPLHDRIGFQKEGDLVSLRQPQLELKPFDRARLKDVGLRLRELYPAGDPSVVAREVTPEKIEALVDEVTKGFGGDVGVVPRQFMRRLVNRFDVVLDNPGATLTDVAPRVEEERAAQGKKPIEYEPEVDDDKGYAVTSVEF